MGTDTKTVPIFPLPELVFFPNTLLPLHVYEPRYKEMITDALAGDRFIGVVQLRPGFEADYYGSPPVYKTLGVGEIVQHHQLDDGRYDILVEGRYRGHIVTEGTRGEYRTAQVEVVPDVLPGDAREEVEWVHQRLLQLYRKLAAALPDTVQMVDGKIQTEPTPGELVDAMASVFVENAYDKQSLLSEPDVARRQRLLRVQLRSLLKASGTE